MVLKGGCLCGAVRWEADRAPDTVHHCHCGMCRRWTGAAFATLVWFSREAVAWKGEPAIFRSSPIAIRSHCATCGTPIHLAYDGQNRLALTLGSVDEPAGLTPTHHYGTEGRLPWAAEFEKDLPAKETQERW